MADNYAELYYHLIWATKDRVPYLDGSVSRLIFDYISLLCRERRVRVLALNGMADHVHLVCTVPTSLSLSVLLNDLKGKSTYHIKHEMGPDFVFAWQLGYGALTFAKRDLDTVVKYVRNQQQHHAAGTLNPKMELSRGDSGP